MSGSPSTADPDRDDRDDDRPESEPIVTVGQLGRLLGASEPDRQDPAVAPTSEPPSGPDDDY